MGATKRKTADYYIAKDHEEPTTIAVYRAADSGRHQKVATGFASREEAQGWINYHQVGQQ